MQRKVFRIESMMPAKRQSTAAAPSTAHRSAAGGDAERIEDLQAELAFIHDIIGRNRRDLAKLIGDGNEPRMTRAADELDAAIDGMQGATETILTLAEAADDGAKALAASLKDEYKRGLAQDIQDNVVKIFEACNFQDLAGQRIAKVMTMLADIEHQVAAILARSQGVYATAPRPVHGNGLINGPKLDRDAGHASQNDIDRMFG